MRLHDSNLIHSVAAVKRQQQQQQQQQQRAQSIEAKKICTTAASKIHSSHGR
jgi:hypothetical protein